LVFQYDPEVPKCNVQHLQIKKNSDEWKLKGQNHPDMLFLLSEELSITYLILKNHQWTKHSTYKFWNVYDSTFSRKRDQIFGKRSGFHIMTLYSHTGIFVQTTDTSLTISTFIWYESLTNIQSYMLIVRKSTDEFWKIVSKMSSGIVDMLEWMFKARQWIHWRPGQCVCVCVCVHVCVCCMYFTESIQLLVRSISLREFSACQYQGLILHFSCVPEKVGVNKKGVNNCIKILK
jgi:hypothetical protein